MPLETEQKKTGGAAGQNIWALVGKMGTAVGVIVGGITIYTFVTKDEPDLRASCSVIPARASAYPLIRSQVSAIEATAADVVRESVARQQAWTQQQRESFLRDVELARIGRPLSLSHLDDWARDGYVSCDVANVGSKPAHEAVLSVLNATEISFFDGTTVTTRKPGELVLGDMRPGARKLIEFFPSGPVLTPVFSRGPETRLSHADGGGRVSYSVQSTGWVSYVPEVLNGSAYVFVGFLFPAGALIFLIELIRRRHNSSAAPTRGPPVVESDDTRD